MNHFFENRLDSMGLGLLFILPLLFILFLVWSIFWKGLALWHSARRNEGWWFVILLIFNTGGILEIIYLFLVAKVPTNELFDKKNNPQNPSSI